MNARTIRSTGLVLTLLATLSGLAGAAILLVDYVRPVAVYCSDAHAGCSVLRTTKYAGVAGVPTPLLGLVGFFVLALLALAVLLAGRRPSAENWANRARLGLVVASGIGAIAAAFLLSIQAKLGVFCRYCVIVDVSTLVVAAGAFMSFLARPGPSLPTTDVEAVAPSLAPPRRGPRFGLAMPILYAVATVAAVAAPLAFGFTRPLPPPQADGVPQVPWPMIERELDTTPSSKVTVVDFADFECPFCRMTHAQLGPVLDKYASRIRLVRKQIPLRSIHPHSLQAAVAACCGERLGKEREMAEALFSAPVEQLTPEGCSSIASSVGLDKGAFEACMKDPAVTERIDRETAEFRAAGGRGLPTIWIDNVKFVGAHDASTYEEVLSRALKNRS